MGISRFVRDFHISIARARPRPAFDTRTADARRVSVNTVAGVRRAGRQVVLSQLDAPVPPLEPDRPTRKPEEPNSLGDTALRIRLRLTLARAEAQRGLLEAAEHHHASVAALLPSSPNDWLEGVLKLDASSIAYLRSDAKGAQRLARSALELSGISGHARTRSAALANLSFIHLNQGLLGEAQKYLEAALDRDDVVHELRMGLLDSYAQLELARGDLPACESLLDQIERRVAPNGRMRRSWYQPLFRLTRARLLLRRTQPEQAVRVLNEAIALGTRHSDCVQLRLLKADALTGLDRLDESAAVFEVTALSGSCPPSVAAEIGRVKGDLLARLGEPAIGRRHLERAVRVLSIVGSAHAREQAQSTLARLTALPPGTPRMGSVRPGIVDAAALLDLAPNPELLGREALAIITDLECAQGAALVATRNGFPLEVLAQHGWSATEARRIVRATEPERRLLLGEQRDRRFYLTVTRKPDISSRDLLSGIRTCLETAVALERHRQEERQQASLMPFDPTGDPDFVFLSDQMLKIVAIARRIAAGNLPVLITGETGTGKEVIARLIHAASDRAEQGFVAFNCTGLPRDTADSQLFGHRRGAFTDAHEHAPGIIRGVAGGTLMLDEIGELDLSIQPTLLRFLDSGEVQPVGEPRAVPTDVRVIAATNVPIETLVREGRFREDLYYRLNVVRLHIPPLRERREEIPPLVRHFLRRYCREMDRGGLDLSQDVLACLLLYDWPGNVRQLANEIRRIVAMSEPDERITPHDLSHEIRAAPDTARGDPAAVEHASTDPDELNLRMDQPLSVATEQLERAMIRRAIRETGGRVDTAAKLLGLSRKGLFLKRRRLSIDTDTIVAAAPRSALGV